MCILYKIVERAYLICNYFKGIFDDEYSVNFKCSEKEGGLG
jgi:hypothetical protein